MLQVGFSSLAKSILKGIIVSTWWIVDLFSHKENCAAIRLLDHILIVWNCHLDHCPPVPRRGRIVHVAGPDCFAKTASGEKEKLFHLRQVVSSNDCRQAKLRISCNIVDSTIVENTMQQKTVDSRCHQSKSFTYCQKSRMMKVILSIQSIVKPWRQRECMYCTSIALLLMLL